MSDATANLNRNGSLTMSKTTIVGDVKIEYSVTIYPASDENFDRWIPDDILEIGHRSIERLMKSDDDEAMAPVDDLEPMFPQQATDEQSHREITERLTLELVAQMDRYAAQHMVDPPPADHWHNLACRILEWVFEKFRPAVPMDGFSVALCDGRVSCAAQEFIFREVRKVLGSASTEGFLGPVDLLRRLTDRFQEVEKERDHYRQLSEKSEERGSHSMSFDVDTEGNLNLPGATRKEQAEAIARRNLISRDMQHAKGLEQALDDRDRLWISAISGCVPASDVMRICRRMGEELA